MASTTAARNHTISSLYSRNWGPYDGGPGWHNHLELGAIAAIVSGIFFFLMLLGCICLTYSSRFTGRLRSRNRSTRSYYTNTSYAGTAAQRGGGGSSVGGVDGADTNTGTSGRNKSKRQRRHKSSSTRSKLRQTVSSYSSPSSASSVLSGESAPEGSWK